MYVMYVFNRCYVHYVGFETLQFQLPTGRRYTYPDSDKATANCYDNKVKS